MNTMTLQALSEALDTWGPDLAVWPRPLAAAARQLLGESDAARSELAAAQKLQQTLDALPVIAAPAALKVRISSAPPPDRWEQLGQWFTAALWRPLLTAALSLLLGFSLGFSSAGNQPANDLDLQTDISLLAFISSLEDYTDE